TSTWAVTRPVAGSRSANPSGGVPTGVTVPSGATRRSSRDSAVVVGSTTVITSSPENARGTVSPSTSARHCTSPASSATTSSARSGPVSRTTYAVRPVAGSWAGAAEGNPSAVVPSASTIQPTSPSPSAYPCTN